MATSSPPLPCSEDLMGPWYEDLKSKLALGHPFLTHATDYIADGIPMILPDRHRRPHRPPAGATTFFVGQFEGRLRLPIPSSYFDLLVFLDHFAKFLDEVSAFQSFPPEAFETDSD